MTSQWHISANIIIPSYLTKSENDISVPSRAVKEYSKLEYIFEYLQKNRDLIVKINIRLWKKTHQRLLCNQTSATVQIGSQHIVWSIYTPLA